MKTDSPENVDQRGHGNRRLLVSIALLALAVLTAPLFVVAVWMQSEITDTDQYVKAIGTLADNPDVQKDVADDLTKPLKENVAPPTLLRADPPPVLQPLSGTMATA